MFGTSETAVQINCPINKEVFVAYDIARCQSFLQLGRPAHDVLVYWPVHDLWRREADEDMLHHFQVHNANIWLYGTPFHSAAKTMQIACAIIAFIVNLLLY